MTIKYGWTSIAGKMESAIAGFQTGDLRDDIYGLLERVERMFPHWETALIIKTTAHYLRKSGDADTANAILLAIE
jgi:hypothetical protein